MTHLASYMSQHMPPKTQAEWAGLFGISRNYVSELSSGVKRPSLDLAFRIERATDGAVPASTWVTP